MIFNRVAFLYRFFYHNKGAIKLNILFLGDLANNLQEQLKDDFSTVEFTFTEDIVEAKKYAPTADVLATYGGQLDREIIEIAEKLKWVMVLSAGVDPLPADLIEERNILVTNVRGIHKISMAEYAISMLLQVYRQEKEQIKLEKEKVWNKRNVKLDEITGKTMLVLGTGAIGQEVARLAKAFRMTTYGVSRSGKDVEHFDQCYKISELDQLLPKVDFVIAVLPSTKETAGLITYDHFKLMQNHAVFLNMGRGDLVTSDDIIKAVRNSEIAHAVLDVFEQEPLPKDHPLWTEENVTVTPHISGLSPYYQQRAIEIFKHNLDVFLTGENNYINKINISRGY